MSVTHPALVEFEAQRATAARIDLLTTLIQWADNRGTDEQAAKVALACGLAVTPDDIEALRGLAYDADHPDVALDRLEFDHGPLGGDRHVLLAGIADTAQRDYDQWIRRVAADGMPVAVETAVLAVLNILGSER